MLCVMEATKHWGASCIWADVTFEIGSGELATLTGASGSGKSTLLRVAAGLESLDAGAVTWRGEELCPQRRIADVIYVGQDHGLFSHRNVLDQIVVPLRCVKGDPKRQAVEAGYYWLEVMGLQDHATKDTRQLSGGQRQRLAIARAAALQPQLFCLDEPTSAQDEHRAADILDVLQDLAKAGCAVLVSTHDVRMVSLKASKQLHLEGGVLIEHQTAAALTTP